jgi:transcriptional regulator with XRE-family HTH domain
MDCIQAFGDVLRSERVRLGLTQQDVALRAGVHINFVGRIERGQAEPSLSTIFAIAKALEMPAESIIEKVGLISTGRHSAGPTA